MTPSLVAALALFAFVASITPGPNNMMLLASGANFGFRRSVPHMLGVSVGFGPMVVAVGWGLGGLFALAPWLYDVLRWAGAAYMVYLAWRIATTEGLKAGAADGEPMTFLQAAAFQWVNPKAWAMALGAVTAYAPTAGYVFNVVAVAVIFTLINGPCVASWAGFGQGLRRFLDRPTALRTFNIAMALLLLASLIPFFMELGGKASAFASSR